MRAGTSGPANVQTAIRTLVEDVRTRQQEVGVSVAVLAGGETVFSEGLGLADLEHDVPMTRVTRSFIASVTKAFTGAALLKLHEDGGIDLDAPIQRYVPEWPRSERGVITPQLLAGHLAGIRHYHQGEKSPGFLATHYDDVADALRLFRDDPLAADPGAAYSYSSYGYNLLAAVIQSAAGRPFPRFVTDTILAPLGLHDTMFDDVRRPVRHRARHYSFYDPWTHAEGGQLLRVPAGDYSYNMGGGNMLSTADDLVRFGRSVVRPGFFSHASLELLHTKQKTAQAESPWSFGWFVKRDGAGRRYLSMSGAVPGAQAGLVAYPDEDVVVAVLSNTWGVRASSAEMVVGLPERMAGICFGHPPAPA